MWWQCRVPLPRFGVRALVCPVQPLSHLAEWVDQSQLRRPGLEEGSVLYGGSVTTDLLHPPRRPHLPIAAALQSTTSWSKGKNSPPGSSAKPGTRKLISVGGRDPVREEFAGKLW